jgi:hypothetical protein
MVAFGVILKSELLKVITPLIVIADEIQYTVLAAGDKFILPDKGLVQADEQAHGKLLSCIVKVLL